MHCEDGEVIFVPDEFRTTWEIPEDVASDAQLLLYFKQATHRMANDGCNTFPCETRILAYTWLILHYIAVMQGGGRAVGSITSATQGSVSIGLRAPASTPFTAPLQQTQFGQNYLDILNTRNGFRWVGARRRPSCCNRRRPFGLGYY